MSYVMVPVPEEYAAKVRRYAVWGVGQGSADAWDQVAVARLLRDYDEQARTVVLRAAEAALSDDPLTVGQAARMLDCSIREVMGIAVEITHTVRAAGGPVLTLATEKPGGSWGLGPRPETWELSMALEVARFVLEAGSSDL